jgi:phosphoenolpyruvate---glycerone phosphotransferase subunit DhaL
MTIDSVAIRKLLTTAAERIFSHADELTALDQVIGDGDHGLNMKRGFEAVLAEVNTISAQPLPQALQSAGTTLVMKVGGASGPLYGTLLISLGKAMPAAPSRADIAQAFGAAIAAVQARGRSEPGQKTMLDVLVPVQRALAGDRPLRNVAAEAAAATVPMRASRGRASFLGDRSIGHMDPGARSSQILIGAVLDVLEGKV